MAECIAASAARRPGDPATDPHGTHCPPIRARAYHDGATRSAASARAPTSGGAILSVPPDFSGPLPSVHPPLHLTDSAPSVSARCLPKRLARSPAAAVTAANRLGPGRTDPMMDADSSISADLVLVAAFAPRSHPPPARPHRDAGRADVGRACSSVIVKNENAGAQLLKICAGPTACSEPVF